MQPDRILFAPAVDGFPALGAESADDLFQPDRLATWSRAEILPSRAGDRVVRVPLPGTPDEWGKVYERPRGAGTGHVILRRYHTSFRGGLVARMSHPRSESLAERGWNLSCKLREAGVGTPDLVLAAARGSAFFARESVLVVRDLEGMQPVSEWLEAARASESDRESDRELGLESVRKAIERLERSGVVLPELELRDIFVTTPSAKSGSACSSSPESAAPGPLRRLPGVVFANLRGGFQVADVRERRALAAAAKLKSELESAIQSSTSKLSS